ncbi:MAG TPA: L-threonylcarbamoyladenylate synthase [Bacteroidota bacterium]|nr:L-threonylcarbamoyladenylate synthase [Bacteroidota bacterium]
MYLKTHPLNPQKRNIATALETLRNGGIIIYPTDTVYGFGCSIFDTRAIDRIYQIKQQDASKPFSFICSDLSHISEFAKVSNPAYRMMKQLIPGPFTFILPASRLKQLPKSLISSRKTVGIRVPGNEICRAIVRELGHPLLNASVTIGDDEIVSDPEEIKRLFGKQVDIILDGGVSATRFSTVLDLTEEQPVIVREGAGDISDLLISEARDERFAHAS